MRTPRLAAAFGLAATLIVAGTHAGHAGTAQQSFVNGCMKTAETGVFSPAQMLNYCTCAGREFLNLPRADMAAAYLAIEQNVSTPKLDRIMAECAAFALTESE